MEFVPHANANRDMMSLLKVVSGGEMSPDYPSSEQEDKDADCGTLSSPQRPDDVQYSGNANAEQLSAFERGFLNDVYVKPLP